MSIRGPKVKWTDDPNVSIRRCKGLYLRWRKQRNIIVIGTGKKYPKEKWNQCIILNFRETIMHVLLELKALPLSLDLADDFCMNAARVDKQGAYDHFKDIAKKHFKTYEKEIQNLLQRVPD